VRYLQTADGRALQDMAQNHDFSDPVKRFNQPDADDLAAFHAAVAGSTPLRKQQHIVFDPPKPCPRPRQRELDEAAAMVESLHAPLQIDDWLDLGDADSFLRPGLPRSVLRDLRSGRWVMQEHVDLHGMNRHEAHEQVILLLAEALSTGKRCLRIVHGRGHGSPGREGILRQLVKSWLGRRKEVLAFCHAPPRDGGDGALWVLLKASRAR
jgi:DNA-nicking Smr family endonuclease